MKQIRFHNMNLKNLIYKNRLRIYHKDFLIRISEMTNNGFTLYEAVAFLNTQYIEIDKEIKEEALKLLESGKQLSELLDYFNYSDDIVMQVQFAEQYGDLNMTLVRCYDYLESKAKLASQLIKTIQYPLILILIFITLIFTVNLTVLPQFQSMYDTMDVNVGIEITVMTAILFSLPYIIYSFILLFIALVLAYTFYFRKQSVAGQLKILFSVPLIRDLYRLYITYRFSEMLSFFLSNGVMMKRILQILSSQNKNETFRYIALMINHKLLEGRPLPAAVKDMNIFEPSLVQFMEHGERNSKLDKELKYYSEFIFDRFQHRLLRCIKAIQPVIFMILALLIVTMYLVIILPMLQMMEGIK